MKRKSNKRSNQTGAQQMGFDWTWAQRREWINEAQLPSGQSNDRRSVSAAAMAGVLNAINDHLGQHCEAWPSQATIAGRLKLSTKTVQRACEALQRLSLMIVDNRPGPSGTKNYYRLVWSEIQLLSPDRRAAWSEILRQQSSDRPSDIVSDALPENGPGPSDTVSGPSDIVSGPSDIVSTENNKKTTKEDNNNPPQGNSPGADHHGTAEWDPVVVVSNLGIVKAQEAITMARTLDYSNSDIERRIAAFRALPVQQQRPGTLYNWLTKHGSFTMVPVDEPRLKLAKGLEPTDERRRADLIRYGREQQWTPGQLQAAVRNFETQITEGEPC